MSQPGVCISWVLRFQRPTQISSQAALGYSLLADCGRGARFASLQSQRAIEMSRQGTLRVLRTWNKPASEVP